MLRCVGIGAFLAGQVTEIVQPNEEDARDLSARISLRPNVLGRI